jgi:signal transduction histidine kinase/ActR/RegA family two-component response regulator
LGKAASELLWQENDQEFADEEHPFAYEIPDQHEIRLKKKSGEIIWVQIGVAPVVDADNEVIGSVRIHTDITERKRAEETRAKLEAQLRQSQKMEAVGTLAGGIAHDFNNLLTAIMGYSGLALDELSPDDPRYNDIQGIQKTAQRAADLTRQLLAFARRQVVEPRVLDLNELILNMGKMLHRLIGEDIELVTLPGPNPGLVKVDPGQFEQVLVNLAINARDAMPNGGKLTIETANVILDLDYIREHAEVIPGEYVMLAVSDNGVGMTEEVKFHIFEPFFTTKEVDRGTGLGLATCFGIVKQSNGHIWVYSEPGQGTTFKVYLPRIDEEKPDFPFRHKEFGDLPRGSETVLLVEDEESVRELAARMLRQQGYKLLEAANGNEALQLVQKQPDERIHLVVTDVIMPQMGGKALTDQLKTMRPDIKVLFISGYTDKAVVHHGLLESGIAFLQKPFSPQMLVRKVREVLDEDPD